MSLINQALKLEQQKRHGAALPAAPMVSRMAQRGQNDKLPLLLFGFTGMGMLLAASVTAIFYFGSEFLDPERSLAASDPAPAAGVIGTEPKPQAARPEPSSPRIEDLLGTLSKDQLSTVQKMLLEREASANSESGSGALAEASERHDSPGAQNLSEISRVQDIVDTYSVQGIRKSGQETRVFLDGKIRRIGDIVDIENSIRLIGFTETALVFQNPNGLRFEKAL